MKDSTSRWRTLALLAIAELVADKLPKTPSRKAPPSFAFRVFVGAFLGAALSAGASQERRHHDNCFAGHGGGASDPDRPVGGCLPHGRGGFDVRGGSAENYTALGYGDVVLSERWQLLGPLEAINGLLLFGLSTAVMFAIMSRLITHRLRFQLGHGGEAAVN